MPTYETVFVNRGEAPAEKIQETTAKIQKMIQEKGEILISESLGRKKLCYEIRGCHDGNYSRIVFSAETGFIKDLDSALRVNEDILRHIIVRTHEAKSRFAGYADDEKGMVKKELPVAEKEPEKKEE